MVQAKKVLGDRVCIRGNVPGSLLATGTPDDVEQYCIKLIGEAGRDGGFILDTATSLDDAKPENVRVMFDVVGPKVPRASMEPQTLISLQHRSRCRIPCIRTALSPQRLSSWRPR